MATVGRWYEPNATEVSRKRFPERSSTSTGIDCDGIPDQAFWNAADTVASG
ncbi:hypothetical protein RESH_05556 [Rhodopirellula europaea SH398]|uniref:Uncharacterized protein n=1 Tax=Rhodopirellula europaea SH398 TaxID=1263868 RepID=M5RX30_9BACT|nr:hypothetical protein RESH_05556 [Rhodopirellula europaea SH398]